MKPEPSITGLSLGYISSGRFDADRHLDYAREARRAAHWCFRMGLRWEGKRAMHDARRDFRNYRYYLAKVIQ